MSPVSRVWQKLPQLMGPLCMWGLQMAVRPKVVDQFWLNQVISTAEQVVHLMVRTDPYPAAVQSK
jgi:hypothetical protein